MGSAPIADPVLPCQKPKCWIEIEVLEEDGKPAAGEAYKVELPDGELKEGKLDDKGTVRFEQIACGICKVWFPDTDAVEIAPAPAARYSFDWIAIELLEEDGTPIGGEPYWVRDPSGEIHEGKLDSKGYVRIDQIPSGVCEVKFPDTARDECLPDPRPAPQPPADPAAIEAWVAAEPLDWIEIELTDGEGEPIPDEPYWIKLVDGRIREGDLDRRGFARVDGIRTGICQVKFPQIDQNESERVTPPPRVVTADTVEKLTWIELELTEDDDVTPVPGVEYRVTLPDGAVREGKLDANGRVRIDGIPGGKCRVELPFEESECVQV